jgi:hypothetical protein
MRIFGLASQLPTTRPEPINRADRQLSLIWLSLFREAPLVRGGDYFPNQWDGGKACDVDAENDYEKQEACTYTKLYPQ